MFKRRHRYTVSQRMREVVWPRMGWGRSSKYLAHRIGRLPGSPHSIAAGFASGAAASMTPFVGLHFLLGFALAWVLRGSMMGAALGTIVGNPWTFPAIWYASYIVGCWLLGRVPGHDTPAQVTLSFLMEHPWQVFLPMILGGLVMAVPVWAATYAIAKPVIQLYQQRRTQRRSAAAARATVDSGVQEGT